MTSATTRVSVASTVTAELVVKRSRFLATVAPVETESRAREVVAAARADHPKARHHCSAFVLGSGPAIQRSSDDGEPSGTAGIPILDVLTGRGLTDVVAVVTRYFGGTLLGAGGLARAYGGAVSAALDGAPLATRELLVPVTVELDYPTAEAVRAHAGTAGWRMAGQEYGAAVTLTLAVAPDDVTASLAALADASAGRAEPVAGEPDWF